MIALIIHFKASVILIIKRVIVLIRNHNKDKKMIRKRRDDRREPSKRRKKNSKAVISKKKKKFCDRDIGQNRSAFKKNISFDSGLDSMDRSLVESIEYLSDILAEEDVENNFDSGFH